MEKKDLEGYLEFFSYLVDCKINKELADLLNAADESQIHTFGWPIGVVLHNDKRPKPYSQNGIKAIIDDTRWNSFDYWTLDRDGKYYILASLFEDTRAKKKIFIDTRTIRTAELFLRTARLYKLLGVPEKEVIACKIEYGGLLDRGLTAANPLRVFSFSYERKCSVDVISKEYIEPISQFLNKERLKEIAYEVIKSITEMCDMFVPSKTEVTDKIVEEFLEGRIS